MWTKIAAPCTDQRRENTALMHICSGVVFVFGANYEQFDNRSLPFAGDYLWITSLGNFSFGTWTDYRNTVQGMDQRETNDQPGGTQLTRCASPLESSSCYGQLIHACEEAAPKSGFVRRQRFPTWHHPAM
jgi:hypothetical protein